MILCIVTSLNNHLTIHIDRLHAIHFIVRRYALTVKIQIENHIFYYI
jgi:hypothetical protein